MWHGIMQLCYLGAGIGMLALSVWLAATEDGRPVARWPRRPSAFCPGLPFRRDRPCADPCPGR